MAIRVMLLTGQSNQYHDWRASSAALGRALEAEGRFDVTTVTSPAAGEDMSRFAPAFDAFDVVVLDYEGDDWPGDTRQALVDRIESGGGLVIYHAANNGFPAWPEFQQLCGVGGWGGRDESSGPKVRWRDGRQVLDDSPGVAMHPDRHDFAVVTRAAEHPIMRGLPAVWMHADDELYSQLRGPARNLEVLATASADPSVYERATGEHEPVLMTIRYGAGRVFHTVLGHVGPSDGSRTTAVDCPGFIVTLQRGTEWAATGAVGGRPPGVRPMGGRPLMV